MPTLPKFRYTQERVTIGNLVFDGAALNAFLARAESAFGEDSVVYALKSSAYGDPAKAAHEADVLELDCSGYAWWATFRKRLGYIWDDKTTGWKANWVEIDRPIPGAVVRYSAPPGKAHGHVGIVIDVGDDDFSSLDSSTDKNPPRSGSIRFLERASSKWLTKPQPRFVVSTQALLEVNGHPYARTSNLWLAAAKRPFTASVMTLVLAWTAWAGWRRWRRK